MTKAGLLQKTKGKPAPDPWTQIDTPHGGMREDAPGRFHLPAASIDRLKARGFSNEEIYSIVAPRRTLARRKELQQELTVAESDRVLRLERIVEHANRVFGDPEKAQRWLRKKSRALEDVRPIDLLSSETGAHIVEQELHRINYGMFT
jgi:putative toxin-antitoxin system antitoxin component (TIGR02293 family)